MSLYEEINKLSDIMIALKQLHKQLKSQGRTKDATLVYDEWHKHYQLREQKIVKLHAEQYKARQISQDHVGYPVMGYENSKPKPKYGCECGAHHTSFPDSHSDWCPLYRRK